MIRIAITEEAFDVRAAVARPRRAIQKAGPALGAITF
jgi:hypothetical protein